MVRTHALETDKEEHSLLPADQGLSLKISGLMPLLLPVVYRSEGNPVREFDPASYYDWNPLRALDQESDCDWDSPREFDETSDRDCDSLRALDEVSNYDPSSSFF